MEDEPKLNFANDERRGRYQVTSGDRMVGYSEYDLEPGRIVFTHTVVRPEFEGQGIGSRLAEHVVEDARARNLRITPVCPFVRSYLRRHPEYEPIVDYPVNSR